MNLKCSLYNKEGCLTVPSSAVFKTGDQYYAYESRGGRAVMLSLQVEYQTGTKTVVTGGLKEGEKVVTQVDSEDIDEGARLKEK